MHATDQIRLSSCASLFPSILRRGAVALMLIALSSAAQTVFAASLSTENLQRARLQLDQSYNLDSLGKCYLESLEPDTYRRFKDNEFEFDRIVAEAVEDLKRWVKAYDLNELIVFRTRASFGSYDAAKGGFQFSPFDIDTKYRSQGGRSLKCLGPQTLAFANPELLSVLPMPKDQAQIFLQTRPKSHRGTYSREVHIDLKVRLVRYDAPSLQGVIVEATLRDTATNAVIHTYKETRDMKDLIPQG